ncbi:MAG: hypothetical protein U1E93_15160 [Alphaproteobacteria bacterium]
MSLRRVVSPRFIAHDGRGDAAFVVGILYAKADGGDGRQRKASAARGLMMKEGVVALVPPSKYKDFHDPLQRHAGERR